jgi:hypothetical protein
MSVDALYCRKQGPKCLAFIGLIVAAVACGDPDVSPEVAESQSQIRSGPAGMSLNDGWRVDQHVRLAIDANGDHRTDLVGFGPSGVVVAESQGDGFATPVLALNALGNNGGWTAASSLRTLADVDGDDRPDIIGIGPSGVTVALKKPTAGYTSPAVWTTQFSTADGWDLTRHVVMMGDVNGDGRADIVGIDDWAVYVSLSNGAGFGAKTMWIRQFSLLGGGWHAEFHPRLLADVNNDGRADLVGFGSDEVAVAVSEGSRFKWVGTSIVEFGFNKGWRVGAHIRTVANMNGDAYPDIIGIGPNGVVVALGHNGGFDQPRPWSAELGGAEWDATKYPRLIGDVDGDGLDDVVGIKDDHVYLARSTGSALTALTPVLDDFTFNRGWLVDLAPRLLADVDGDGQLDLVGFGMDAIYWEHLLPAASEQVPSGWDTPTCTASRLGQPAPRRCEGPWRYTHKQRCVGQDPSCPKVCTAFASCPLFENGVVTSSATHEFIGIVGSGEQICSQTCTSTGCGPVACSGTITQPTVACEQRAAARRTELANGAAALVNAETAFDTAAAQATRRTQAMAAVRAAPSYSVVKFDNSSTPGPGGTFKEWKQHWVCNLDVSTAEPVSAVNDACPCQTESAVACEHDCNPSREYTGPGQLRPASPQDSEQECVTHDDLPATTPAEVQNKFDHLWAEYVGITAASPTTTPTTVTEAEFKRAIVTRLKLLYELWGEQLTQDGSTGQLQRAAKLYTDHPDLNPSCMADVDAPIPVAACTSTSVTSTRGDLIRCQRLLGLHASEGAASLAVDGCATLLSGYLDLAAQSGPDNACGGAHLREIGAKSLFKLEDKQIGVISSAKTTLGSLPRQLWLLDRWFTTAKTADSLGVFATADQLQRDTSYLLGRFWAGVRLNSGADAALAGLADPNTSPAQAEAALGLSATKSRQAEQAVVSALFTVPAPIQPESVALTRPPLRGLPQLAILGDALKPFVDDLDGLAMFHDIACQFRDCRTSASNTPSRNAWNILSALEDNNLASTVALSPTELVGWKSAFAKLAAQQPAFRQAVADAVVGGGTLAGATKEADVHPLARPLWLLYRHAQAFHDHYEATGLFESSAQKQLQGSLLEDDQQRVVNGLRDRVGAFHSAVATYRDGLRAVADAQLRAMSDGAQIASLTGQRLRKAKEMDQKSANLEGLRASGEDEEDAFASITKSFADIQGALDHGAYVAVGSTVRFELDGQDGKFTGSRNPVDISVQTVPGLIAGQMLVVTTSGTWTPTCSLNEASFLRDDDGDPVHADLRDAEIGPEGYVVSVSGSDVSAHSAGHAWGLDVSVGTSSSLCASSGAIGEVYGFEGKDCVFEEVRGTHSNTWNGSSGSESRTTSAFSTGLRLPSTPFPDAPVGSLLVVLVDSQGAVRDVKVVHSGATSILIEQPGTAYFVVNDKRCTTAATAKTLEVRVRTMRGAQAVADQALLAMTDVLASMRGKQELWAKQGTLLPTQPALLRQQANLLLQSRLDDISVTELPAPLASLFDAFVSHEIVATERRIEIVAVQRSLDLDLIDLQTIDDELSAGKAHARLQSLIPQWILRDLDHDTLREGLVDLLSVSRDFLKPILEVWYPHTLDSVSSDTGIGREIDNLVNADIDTSLVTLAGHGEAFVNALLTAYQNAVFGSKREGEQLPVVVLSFPRPGAAHTNQFWREADAARARRVWDAIDGGQIGHFEVTPEDFYSRAGGDAVLSCNEVVPLIRTMAFFVVRPGIDSNGTLNGIDRAFQSFGGANQSFVTLEGPRVYQLVDSETAKPKVLPSVWQSFMVPVKYGESESALDVFTHMPRRSRPVGLSATGSFDIDFSVLSGLPDRGGFVVDGVQAATEVQLIMELDSRATGTRPTWISRCQ